MAAPVSISEFLAINNTTLADNAGEYSDWIELHNSGGLSVDISGWVISDGSESFVFPAGTSIAANAYEVLFASGDVARTVPGERHLPFKLSGPGEALTLRDNGGVLTEPSWAAPNLYPAQIADNSYGVSSNGELRSFPDPTPGAANGAGVLGVAASVEFSLEHGFFTSPQSLVLTTATPGAAIRYTTNGETPTSTTGTEVASGATVALGSTTTIRAVAYLDGWTTSSPETRTYIFPADVLTQSATPPDGWPANDEINDHDLDYEMDTEVVAGNEAAVTEALLAIPSVSVVTDLDNLFDPITGIYVNPQGRGRTWERDASVELIDPTGAMDGFDINAGIRIRGGSSRSSNNPKHSLHFYFRSDYEGALEYPVFGDEGTDRFERLSLRTTQHESWTWRRTPEATFVEDVWARDIQAAMDQPYTRSRQVHLYLNGQYWGLYMTQERITDEYGESYFGGDEDDYDVIKRGSPSLATEANDGTITAWQAMYPLVSDGVVTAAEFEQLLTQVDLENLAAYYLQFFYSAEFDGSPTWYARYNGNSFAQSNNWYAIRNRNGVGDAGRWQFLDHDSEVILCQNLNFQPLAPETIDNTTPWPLRNELDYFAPAHLHQALITNASYRQIFAQVVQEEMLDADGALTVANATATYDARVSEVDPAVLAESARWGDGRPNNSGTAFGRTEWQNAVAVERDCLQQRWEVTRQQLTADGLWPAAIEPTVVDLNRTTYDYDFGTTGSPVGVAGPVTWEPITPQTTGDISWSAPVDSRDRGPNGADDIERDLVFAGGPRTLSHRIANGVWAVTLNMGDTCCIHDDMSVTAEGVVISGDVDAPTGTFAEVTGQVVVTDGSLDIEFEDLGGVDVNWVANRLSLERLPDPPAGLILNEWNAVSSDKFIDDGDSFFGSVAGNGGDWFELVVVEDRLDVRGWQLEISDAEAGSLEVTDTFVFGDDPLLSDLRAGTIITVSEDRADDVSFDPATGDWWINFQSNSDDDGAYLTPDSQSNFDTNNDDWQLRIANGIGLTTFGPAGEGVGGVSGVGSTEVGELEEDPSSAIGADSLYDDGKDSTFGSPNGFDGGVQDLSALRAWYVPVDDTVEPDAVIDAPAAGSVVPSQTVTISGTSSDDVGVGSLRVALRNRDTGLWLQADGSFSGQFTYVESELGSPGATLTTWTLPLTLPEARYFAIARAEDTSGNRDSTRPRVFFDVEVPDTDGADPMVEIATPAHRAEVGGPSVTFSGTATDDAGVALVRVTIIDRATGLRLQPDGTFGPRYARLNTALSAPGATSTEWLYSANLADGDYVVIADVVDTANKRDQSRPRVVFSVAATVADDVLPDTAIDSPTVREALTGPSITTTGTATDNVGVTRVRVTIQDVVSKQYLQADGTLGGFTLLEADIDTNGATSTGWRVNADLPVGEYAVTARAVDAAGNTDATRPRVRFSVE